jgi:hypothetical protein
MTDPSQSGSEHEAKMARVTAVVVQRTLAAEAAQQRAQAEQREQQQPSGPAARRPRWEALASRRSKSRSRSRSRVEIVVVHSEEEPAQPQQDHPKKCEFTAADKKPPMPSTLPGPTTPPAISEADHSVAPPLPVTSPAISDPEHSVATELSDQECRLRILEAGAATSPADTSATEIITPTTTDTAPLTPTKKEFDFF